MGIFPDTPESRESWKKYEEKMKIHRADVSMIVKRFSPKQYDFSKGGQAYLYADYVEKFKVVHYDSIDLFSATVNKKYKSEPEMIDAIVKKYKVAQREKKFPLEHGFKGTDGKFYPDDEIFKALVEYVKNEPTILTKIKRWFNWK
ncbi:MAG: hypothetical protein HC836_36080 [Richelia sp. RM2_1_2]|nr:hypothetical protein [Richelia sp. RM2_1_2]